MEENQFYWKYERFLEKPRTLEGEGFTESMAKVQRVLWGGSIILAVVQSRLPSQWKTALIMTR